MHHDEDVLEIEFFLHIFDKQILVVVHVVHVVHEVHVGNEILPHIFGI